MRQLVAVVADGSVRYFIAEGDEVTQIAQITDPGANVATIIEIGVSLGALYTRRNGAKTAPTAKAAPAPASPARRRGKTLRSWGAGQEAILADLRAHPDSTYAEISERVTGSSERGAQQSVTAAMGVLRAKGFKIESRPAPVTDVMGRDRPGVRLTLVE